MNSPVLRTLRTLNPYVSLTLTACAVAFPLSAAATAAPELSYWTSAYAYGSVQSTYTSEDLGSTTLRIDHPGASTSTIDELASANWNIPAHKISGDSIYNAVTNNGQYGYSYSARAQVLGNQLKAAVATSSTDLEWQNPNRTSINASAYASLSDQWLIAPTARHAAGSFGAALVTIKLDGSFPTPADSYNSASAWLSASTSFTDTAGVGYESRFEINANPYGYYTSGMDSWVSRDGSTPGTLSLTKKLLFQYGTPFNLNMSLNTWSSNNGQADFFDTGEIAGVFLPRDAQLQTGSLQIGIGGMVFGNIANATSYDDPNTIWDFGNNGGAIVPGVPEPEAYAMLLAGLGLMGVIARRRARRD